MTSASTRLVSTDSQPRARRVADGFMLLSGLFLMMWGVAGVDRRSPWERELAEVVGLIPSWATSLLELIYTFGLLYGIGLVVTLAVGGSRRRSALRDVMVAAAGAALLAVVVGLWVTGEWPYLVPEIGLTDPTPRFPVLRVVIISAVVAAGGPHLSRPLRRFGWLTITLMAVAAINLGYGVPSDAIGGLGMGLVAAGAVLLAFGSPRGYPDPATVADALDRMGLDLTDLRIAPQQSWGVRRFTAAQPDGATVAIKVYGRDASDSQFLAKVWRTLWYREDSRTLGYSRLQAVEHEALVTMVASRSGVRVPGVVAAGQATPDLALLATEVLGVPLDGMTAAEITDDLLIEVWRDVAQLHGAGLSHGSLGMSAVAVDGDRSAVTDFALGALVAGEADRAEDIVELLFSSSVVLGVDRAVEVAVEGIGTTTLAATLPYLQLPAVSSATRKDAIKPRTTIKELQAAVVDATGQQLPEQVKLRRVTGRSMVMFALLLFAAGALIPAILNVDFTQVADELRAAHWGLVVAALLVGQTMFIPQATGMMFAVPQRLPFWPLAILQVAIEFIGLAVPSVAGRVAVNSAFLRKYGVSLATSVAQGVIDSFAGFLVEVTIFMLAILSGGIDLGVDLDTSSIRWGLVLFVAVLAVVGSVLAVLRIRKLKDRVVPVIRQGREALMGVLGEPSRAFGLVGSNLVTRLVWAATLWLMLESLDASIGFTLVLVAVVATNLLQGIIPIPGGVGVSEAVMTGFLVALGVDQSAAFAATVMYRIITFYLPAVEGFFAMRWLERNEYV